jgi:hypothetical protein
MLKSSARCGDLKLDNHDHWQHHRNACSPALQVVSTCWHRSASPWLRSSASCSSIKLDSRTTFVAAVLLVVNMLLVPKLWITLQAV